MNDKQRSYGKGFADEAKRYGTLNGDAHRRTMPKHRFLPPQGAAWRVRYRAHEGRSDAIRKGHDAAAHRPNASSARPRPNRVRPTTPWISYQYMQMAKRGVHGLSDKAPLPENVERLLQHLDDESLAHLLVRAHHAECRNGTPEVMKKVLQMRLRRARAILDAAED